MPIIAPCSSSPPLDATGGHGRCCASQSCSPLTLYPARRLATAFFFAFDGFSLPFLIRSSIVLVASSQFASPGTELATDCFSLGTPQEFSPPRSAATSAKIDSSRLRYFSIRDNVSFSVDSVLWLTLGYPICFYRISSKTHSE